MPPPPPEKFRIFDPQCMQYVITGVKNSKFHDIDSVDSVDSLSIDLLTMLLFIVNYVLINGIPHSPIPRLDEEIVGI